MVANTGDRECGRNRLHPRTAGTLGVPAVFIFLAVERGVHAGRRSIDYREYALI